MRAAGTARHFVATLPEITQYGDLSLPVAPLGKRLSLFLSNEPRPQIEQSAAASAWQ